MNFKIIKLYLFFFSFPDITPFLRSKLPICTYVIHNNPRPARCVRAAESKSPNPKKTEIHADKNGQLLTQPPCKLAASSTQAFYICLISKYICA